MNASFMVSLKEIKQLSDLICEIDFSKNDPEALKELVASGHQQLIEILGEHEGLIYTDESDEVAA